jgi:hypothetical protein
MYATANYRTKKALKVGYRPHRFPCCNLPLIQPAYHAFSPDHSDLMLRTASTAAKVHIIQRPTSGMPACVSREVS